jgi:DNA-binding winged helix-turn-helix (wHTH) protein
MRASFGDCELDTGRRQLVRAGAVVPLPPKALRLIEVLIEARPRALSHHELHEALWPDTFVARTNLSSLVAELRQAIGDGAQPSRFIRTVHGFGYAFEGKVVDVSTSLDGPGVAEEVAFRLVLEEREVPLRAGENVLGRTSDAVVWLDDPNVSRRHARILIDGHEATLEDLGSKNGTFVQGRRIASPTVLTNGDVIWVGPFSMTFRAYPGGRTTQTSRHAPPSSAD